MWKRWFALGIGALGGAGIAVALVVTVAESPTRGLTLVEVLKVFLSWPVVVGGLGLALGIAFHREIRKFIENIGAIRFGGAEILAKQQPTPATETKEETPPAAADGSITLSRQDQQIVMREVQKLRAGLDAERQRAGQAEQAQAEFETNVGKLLDEKQGEVIFWWFRYLGLFLVPHTKWVLQWFATRATQATREWFHEEWKASIPNAKEREVILSVLLHHQFLLENGSLLSVSDAGHAFLEFLKHEGFWFPPSLPPPAHK